MILRLLLLEASKILRDAGRETSQRDARLLFSYVDGSEVGTINVRLDEVLSWPDKKHEAFWEMIELRAGGVPVSKILGKKAFWKNEFVVNFDVLDPRPDTETLVEQALDHPFERVLDLGTGSGCILLSLLMERPKALGVGVDISVDALDVARENASRLRCNRAEFIQSNWFENVTGQFDLVVSNPPYISKEEYGTISQEVRDFEPSWALTDKADGLNAYRMITAGAMSHIRPLGCLMVEIGPSQSEDVKQLFVDAGFVEIAVYKDIDGRDRVVEAIKPN